MILPENIHSVCFTGHRDLSHYEESTISNKLSELLVKLTEGGLENCYAGGAIGMDTLAALTVLNIKTAYPDIRLHLILPCRGQENSWNVKQKRDYEYIKTNADSVRVLSPFYYNGCMQARNRELLRNSDLCIAYLRPGTSGGGSLNTVLQATKLGIPIINLAEIESEDLK